jgi:hypothetical protein
LYSGFNTLFKRPKGRGIKPLNTNKRLQAAAVILLALAALTFSACDKDGDNDVPLVSLEGTKWIGLNPGGRPMSFEFGKTQSDNGDNATFTDAEGKVRVTFSHDNSRQNYDYTYDGAKKEGNITNGIGGFTVDKSAGVISFTKFYNHAEGITISKIAAALDDFKEAADGTTGGTIALADIEGTVWAGLNPASRPIFLEFGEINGAVFTFGHDGTQPDYYYTYADKAGAVQTAQDNTGGPGAFTLSANAKVLTFTKFYNFHANLPLVKIK